MNIATVDQQNLARVNRIWPTAEAGEADMELTLSKPVQTLLESGSFAEFEP